MADWLSQIEILGNVLLAMALGGVIGAERQMAHKPAGFRTHMLVAASAAILVGVGSVLVQRYAADSAGHNISGDPVRIIQSIVIGVSFLVAGTIFRHEPNGTVEGLTTAASILLSTCVGIAAATHQYIVAVGATLLALLILRALRFLEIDMQPPKS